MRILRTASRMSALVALTFALTASANAAFAPNVTTTSGMGTFSSYNLLNLTNGKGLSSMDLAGLHSNAWGDMWLASQGTTTGTGFRPQAFPTARAARGRSTIVATSP